MTAVTEQHATIRARAIKALRADFRGDLITPADDGYGQARKVWNGMIDRYPQLIARCVRPADVAAALAFARDEGLPLAVRGGGHSGAGFGVCDSGVVIDLSKMRHVQVDPRTHRARVGGGATWADVDAAGQVHGLAVTGGLVTHTGVGGLTLGGGLGYLMRRDGLACDNLVSADLVDASGRRVTATDDSTPELIWGLRGGGGNFGVVTTFEYRLHEVGPQVYAGALAYRLVDGYEVLRFYRAWSAELPDDIATVIALRSAPAVPHLPVEVHGRPVVMIAACALGRVEDGRRALEPLRRFKEPVADLVEVKPYIQQQAMFNPSAPHGRQNYKRNANLADLSDGAIEVLLHATETKTDPNSLILLFQLGGQVARIPEQATAYSDRAAGYNVDINAQWLSADDPRASEHVEWVRRTHARIQPFSTGGAYVNFLNGDERADAVRAAYGAAKYDRLAALKRQYDSTNLFRMNHNISPDPAGGKAHRE